MEGENIVQEGSSSVANPSQEVGNPQDDVPSEPTINVESNSEQVASKPEIDEGTESQPAVLSKDAEPAVKELEVAKSGDEAPIAAEPILDNTDNKETIDETLSDVKIEGEAQVNQDPVDQKAEKPEAQSKLEISDSKETSEVPIKTDTVLADVKEDKVRETKLDHAEAADKDNSGAKEDLGDMGTLFILDLMRQRKEKLMRKKKDDLINELAMKKKQQMMEAKMGKRLVTRPAIGGFVGVNAILTAGSSPATRRRTPKPQRPVTEDPTPTISTERNDLLIMGMIRDQKEEKFHEAHQVMMEQAGVPSDDKCLARFGD